MRAHYLEGLGMCFVFSQVIVFHDVFFQIIEFFTVWPLCISPSGRAYCFPKDAFLLVVASNNSVNCIAATGFGIGKVFYQASSLNMLRSANATKVRERGVSINELHQGLTSGTRLGHSGHSDNERNTVTYFE